MLSGSGDWKPNVIILGVGHSGTSLMAKVLFTLGWERNDADEVFCESVGMREINDAYRHGDHGPHVHSRAREFLDGLRSPFALKDPRLTFTLPLWISALDAAAPPVLLKLTRNRQALARSYEDRREMFKGGPGMYGRSLDELIQEADNNFDRWPYHKLSVDYEGLVAAARSFREALQHDVALGGEA